MRTIAEKSLTWDEIGPIVQRYRTLLDAELERDTRKLSSLEAFRASVAETVSAPEGGPRRQASNLRTFIEQRRQFLLNHPEIKNLKSVE